VTIGKPAPDIFRTALDRLGPGRALVIGDRADADLDGAKAAGLDGALVGGERSDDAVACASTLADLILA
jgi:FMN phosphatase YigB (HAD superfamily)